MKLIIFAKILINNLGINLLSNTDKKRDQSFCMTISEVMTISIMCHFSGYSNLKIFIKSK
jgi:hypothetical protein